jgi:predicted dehydrogenase
METSQRSELHVGMIGYAFMGRAHSQGWRNVNSAFRTPLIHMDSIVGRDAESVSRAAAELGWSRHFTDWRDVIADPAIDIIDICTPGDSHAEIAIAALEAGKHVIVEKPLANTLDESRRMVEVARAAQSRGIMSAVNFNYRRVPALMLAKEMIGAGKIGEVLHIRGAYLQDWLSDPSLPMSWRLQRERAGTGVLGDLGAHVIDLMMHLTGKSVESTTGHLRTFTSQRPDASGKMQDVTVDDAALATLVLTGRTIANLDVTRNAPGKKNELTLSFFGTEGSISFNLENLNELWFFSRHDSAGEQGYRRILVTESTHPYLSAWWPDGHIIGWEHTFTHQFFEFLTSIETGRPAAPSFEDGHAVQAALAAIADSAAQNSASTRPDK